MTRTFSVAACFAVFIVCALSGAAQVTSAARADDAPAPSKVTVETLLEGSAQRAGAGELTVAVLGFADKGPSLKLAPLRLALAEMLTGDLSQWTGVIAVERLHISELLDEFALGEAGLVDGQTAQRAGQALAADYVIAGDFSGRDETITVDVRLQRVGSEQPLAHWRLSGPVDALVELERQLLERLERSLGIENPTRRPPPEAQAGKSPAVAILALENRSADARLVAMEQGFADILQAHLAALDDVTLIERESIVTVLEEQQLAKSGLADTQTAIKLGKLLGAERLIFGSFFEAGQNLRIELRLADAQTGAVLRAEAAYGPTAEFARLVEELALRLAADLAIEPPENAVKLVEAATPVHKLEAAMHLAEAEQSFRQRRYADAARSYERILLVEPDNLQAGIGRLRSLVFAFDYDRALEVGAAVINRTFSPEQASLKHPAFRWYERALQGALRVEEYKAFYERAQAEVPGTDVVGRMRMGLYALTGDDGKNFLEIQTRIDEAQQAGETEKYEQALFDMYAYHVTRPEEEIKFIQLMERGDVEAAKPLSEKSKQHTLGAFEVYKQILRQAEGQRDIKWANFASHSIASFPTMSYLSTEVGPPYRQPIVRTTRRRLDYLNAALRVFGWHGPTVYKAHWEFANYYKNLKQWDKVIESWQYIFEHPSDAHMYGLVECFDQSRGGTPSFIDNQIDVLFQIATMQERELQDRAAAVINYRRVLEEFGTNHKYAVSAARKLHELGETWAIPEKTVLVWGGRGIVNHMWRDLLQPLGYTVHSVLHCERSAPDLTAYRLVILADPMDCPFDPIDIFALKTYVATGGSLLSVVSPGWHPATPGIHNSLLQLFDVQADHEMAVRAQSTEIVPHPITAGIETAMAKCAVNLRVPEGTGLIRSGDRTVLAAVPYGAGRVVVASFGQWHFPSARATLFNLGKAGESMRSVPRPQRPLETGAGMQLPLLKNVLAWLLEPLESDQDLVVRREPFLKANRLAIETRFGIADGDSLREGMDRLVAEAEPGRWSAEALWTAGEAFFQTAYRQSGKDWRRNIPEYHDDEELQCQPQYFERLVDEFSESPLRPFAQWRLAECDRIQRTKGRGRLSSKSLATYEAVDAPVGSYGWAWVQLRVGQALFEQGKFERALTHFEALAEQMDVGPEKLFGVFSAAACHAALGDKEESQRHFRLIAGFPDLQPGTNRNGQWWPMRVGSRWVSPLHGVARFELGESQYQRYVKKFGEPEDPSQ